MYGAMLVLMLAMAQSAFVGDSQGSTYEISSDSTLVRAQDGGEVISAQELLYFLPDSVYSVEYSKPYFLLPPTLASDRKSWRKLEDLSVAPDGGHVAVIANSGGGVDVLLRQVPDGPLMVVGWWHHCGSDSLYWSPDSRFLLIALNGGENSKMILLELTSDPTNPAQRAAAWDSELGWMFTGKPPTWDMEVGTATVSLKPVPTESSNRSQGPASGTSSSKVIHFRSMKPDGTPVPQKQ